MLANALVQVSGCVPNIICVAEITLKYIDHALIVYNGGLLLSRGEDLWPSCLVSGTRDSPPPEASLSSVYI